MNPIYVVNHVWNVQVSWYIFFHLYLSISLLIYKVLCVFLNMCLFVWKLVTEWGGDKEVERERKWEKERFHMPVHASDGHNSQDRARLKLKAKSFIQVLQDWNICPYELLGFQTLALFGTCRKIFNPIFNVKDMLCSERILFQWIAEVNFQSSKVLKTMIRSQVGRLFSSENIGEAGITQCFCTL